MCDACGHEHNNFDKFCHTPTTTEAAQIAKYFKHCKPIIQTVCPKSIDIANKLSLLEEHSLPDSENNKVCSTHIVVFYFLFLKIIFFNYHNNGL